jgi:hypothetical protein
MYVQFKYKYYVKFSTIFLHYFDKDRRAVSYGIRRMIFYYYIVFTREKLILACLLYTVK